MPGDQVLEHVPAQYVFEADYRGELAAGRVDPRVQMVRDQALELGVSVRYARMGATPDAPLYVLLEHAAGGVAQWRFALPARWPDDAMVTHVGRALTEVR